MNMTSLTHDFYKRLCAKTQKGNPICRGIVCLPQMEIGLLSDGRCEVFPDNNFTNCTMGRLKFSFDMINRSCSVWVFCVSSWQMVTTHHPVTTSSLHILLSSFDNRGNYVIAEGWAHDAERYAIFHAISQHIIGMGSDITNGCVYCHFGYTRLFVFKAYSKASYLFDMSRSGVLNIKVFDCGDQLMEHCKQFELNNPSHDLDEIILGVLNKAQTSRQYPKHSRKVAPTRNVDWSK